jgi:Ankyrin repeats (3 copies)
MLRWTDLAMVAVLGVLPLSVSSAQQAGSIDKADALSEAARQGDVAAVKRLIDEGVDVNTKFRYGATALSYASDRGDVEVVKLLLDRGAEVNVKDTFYNATPLTWAVSPARSRTPQHAEVVRLLLQHGAEGKDQALIRSVEAGDVKMTGVILDVGGLSGDALSNALEGARAAKRGEIVSLLEKAGAKPLAEFGMSETELARFAGTYRSSSGTEIVFVIADGRLTGGPAGQRIPFVARSATTFSAIGIPNLMLTFVVEDGKVAGITLGQAPNATSYNRVESNK